MTRKHFQYRTAFLSHVYCTCMLIIIIHTVRLSGLYAEKNTASTTLLADSIELVDSTRTRCLLVFQVITDVHWVISSLSTGACCSPAPSYFYVTGVYKTTLPQWAGMAAAQHRWGYTGNCGELSYMFRMQALTRYFWRKSRPQRWNALATALARWYLIQHSSEHFSIQKKWFCRQKKIKIKNDPSLHFFVVYLGQDIPYSSAARLLSWNDDLFWTILLN